MALAVKAIMGIEQPWPRKNLAVECPSISGICISVSNNSNGRGSENLPSRVELSVSYSIASFPFSTMRTSAPALRST